MQLSDMVDRFVRDVCAGKTNATPAAYRSKLRHLERYLGAERETFGQAEIDEFRKYLLNRKCKRRGGHEIKGCLSKFTLRSVLSTTRHFLRWSAQKEIIPQGIKLINIREPTPDPKPVKQITVELLLASAAENGEEWERARNTAILYVLRDTGGRVGAISRIDIEHLDLKHGYATAPDKNEQLAWLWLNPPTVAAIRAWLELRGLREPKDDYLFTGSKGCGLSTQGIRRMLSRLASAGGVTGRHNPHSFRHAFARDAILAGADLGQVADLMGHSGVAVTYKYYSRWTKKELKRFHAQYSPGRDLPMPGKRSAKP